MSDLERITRRVLIDGDEDGFPDYLRALRRRNLRVPDDWNLHKLLWSWLYRNYDQTRDYYSVKVSPNMFEDTMYVREHHLKASRWRTVMSSVTGGKSVMVMGYEFTFKGQS